MATYAYVPAFDELLTEAWERCGKSPAVLNGDVVRSARRSFQLMFLDWSNDDAALWRIVAVALTLTAGQASLPLTPELIDVLQATVSVNGSDITMTAIGRDDYVGIPNKSTSGQPTQYWVQRILPAPVMLLYPTPDQSYGVTAWCLRQPQDVSASGIPADFPVLFSEAVNAGLAARLALKFAPDRVQLLDAKAAAAYAKATGENRERVPLRVAPRISRW